MKKREEHLYVDYSKWCTDELIRRVKRIFSYMEIDLKREKNGIRSIYPLDFSELYIYLHYKVINYSIVYSVSDVLSLFRNFVCIIHKEAQKKIRR